MNETHDLLNAVEAAITTFPECQKPFEITAQSPPEHGVVAGENIREYTNHAADYIESVGHDILVQAQGFANNCLELANNLRESAERYAESAVDLTLRVREAAKGVDEVGKKFMNGEKSGTHS